MKLLTFIPHSDPKVTPLLGVLIDDDRTVVDLHYSEKKQLNCPIYSLGSVNDSAINERQLLDWQTILTVPLKYK